MVYSINITSTTTQSEIETYNFTQVYPDDIGNMSLTQLSWVSGYQISVLDNTQISSLTNVQIENLNTSQIEALTTTQLENLDINQLNSLDVTQLTISQIGNMSTTQFSNLEVTNIGKLSEIQVGILSTEQLNSLSIVQIQGLNLSGLDPFQLNSLEGYLIEAFYPNQVSLINSDILTSLSSTFLSHITAVQIPYFEVYGLTPDQLRLFTSEQKNAITPEQKSLLSNAQLEALGFAVPCLCENTKILTPKGYVTIEKLKINDLVLTDDNREIKIKNIFTTIVKGNNLTYPYIIKKDSISENYPPEDCKLSRNHLIKNGENWIHPKLSGLFKVDKSKEMIKYYHIQLENYETDHLVINGGLVVESYTSDSASDKLVWKNRVKIYHDRKFNIL